MIKCPSCGESYPENTLFCDECGTYLLANGNNLTDSLPGESVSWVDNDTKTADSANAPGTRPLNIRIAILDTGRQLELPLNKEINIGRLDATSATFPEVDLTADRGLEKGVSRRHAKITRKGSGLFLEDLGSVNGTFLNGRRLTPYLPHALSDKDEVRIGKVMLRIYLS